MWWLHACDALAHWLQECWGLSPFLSSSCMHSNCVKVAHKAREKSYTKTTINGTHANSTTLSLPLKTRIHQTSQHSRARAGNFYSSTPQSDLITLPSCVGEKEHVCGRMHTGLSTAAQHASTHTGQNTKRTQQSHCPHDSPTGHLEETCRQPRKKQLHASCQAATRSNRRPAAHQPLIPQL